MRKAVAVFARQQQRDGVAIAAQRHREKAGRAERRLKQQHELAIAGRQRRAYAEQRENKSDLQQREPWRAGIAPRQTADHPHGANVPKQEERLASADVA